MQRGKGTRRFDMVITSFVKNRGLVPGESWDPSRFVSVIRLNLEKTLKEVLGNCNNNENMEQYLEMTYTFYKMDQMTLLAYFIQLNHLD